MNAQDSQTYQMAHAPKTAMSSASILSRRVGPCLPYGLGMMPSVGKRSKAIAAHCKTVALLLAIGLHASVVGAWVPPPGMPAPPFCAGGCTVPATALTTLWVNQATGNDGNPGTQALPKQTIPVTTLAAGTIVRVVGTYNYTHTSDGGRQLKAAGTNANPVWIIQETGTWGNCAELTGSYLYVDLTVDYCGMSVTALTTSSTTHHILIQHSEFDGQFGGGGIGVQARNLEAETATISYVQIFGNYIHRLGDLDSPSDVDTHCTSTYKAGISFVWVLENRLERCSGDGFQVQSNHYADSATGANAQSRIYMGRNTCYQLRQTCGWAKQSTDVVFSGNLAQGGGYMRPSSGGQGACFGGQYNPRRVAFISNACLDAENGIMLVSYDDPLPANGGGALIAGNLILDIHCTSCAQVGVFTNGGAVKNVGGGGVVTVMNNTLWGVDYGIQVGITSGTTLSRNNIIGNITNTTLLLDNTPLYSAQSGYNLYPSLPFYDLEGTIVQATQGQIDSAHSVIGDPLFFNTANNDYRLKIGSPAINAGLVSTTLNNNWQSLHGVPTGLNMLNIGAVKEADPAPPPPPPPPDPPDPPPPPVNPISGAPCTCTEED